MLCCQFNNQKFWNGKLLPQPWFWETKLIDDYRSTLYSLQNMNILLLAHVPENLGPYSDTDLPDVCFLEQEHKSAGYTDATADTERNFVINDCLMVWMLEKILLTAHFKLLLECLDVHTDTH